MEKTTLNTYNVIQYESSLWTTLYKAGQWGVQEAFCGIKPGINFCSVLRNSSGLIAKFSQSIRNFSSY